MGVKENIIIIGTGGLGREIASLFLHNTLIEKFNLLGFVDDFKPKGYIANGIEVLGDIKWLIEEKPCSHVIVGFSDLQVRFQLINNLQNHSFFFPTIIHPEAKLIDIAHIKIECGSIIFPNAVLTTNITIGRNVIVHIGAKIHHDTVIHDNCIVMPNVAITGGATIGRNVFLGTGVICSAQITIQENTIIQAGSILSNILI